MWPLRRALVAVGVSVPLVVSVPAAGQSASEPVFERRVSYEAAEAGGPVAVDSSGYDNHGRLKGGVTRRAGVYRFFPLTKDGVHDRIRAAPDDSLNPGAAPFSFGARIKVRPDAIWSHREMALVRHGDSDTAGGDYKLELRRLRSGNVAALCVIHDGDADDFAYVQGNGPLETIDDGRWHEISCARVDVDTVALTVDGHTMERSARGSLGAIVGGDPLLIGVQPWPQQPEIRWREQFNGRIDDIHLTVQLPAGEPEPTRSG